MKEKFKKRKLTGEISIKLYEGRVWVADKWTIVSSISSVVERYSNQGYKLSLRQLYYQLVSKDIIPNHDKVYKKLSGILDDCRYSGWVDWDAIEDRGRVPYSPFSVGNVEEALNLIADQYALDGQDGQPIHVEIWTEKDAISGILKRVTNKYHTRLCVNKGYTSSSAIHSAYERFSEIINEGRKVHILYFGDHDASGLDMVRDIRERLQFMLNNGNSKDELRDAAENWAVTNAIDYEENESGEVAELMKEFFNEFFQITPIGLTMEQIKEYKPPPNPAKITDPRAAWYIKEFGKMSWEVDALSPESMIEIVVKQIENIIDMDIFEEIKQREKVEKKKILSFIKKAA